MNYKEYFKQKLINEYNEDALRRLIKLKPPVTASDAKVARFNALLTAAGGRGGPRFGSGPYGPQSYGHDDPIVQSNDSEDMKNTARGSFRQMSSERRREVRSSIHGRVNKLLRLFAGQNVKSTV